MYLNLSFTDIPQDQVEALISTCTSIVNPASFSVFVQDGIPEESDELTLTDEIREVLNSHSAENDSGTPDFVLATYLTSCLNVFNEAVTQRATWRGESVELPALRAIRGEKQ